MSQADADLLRANRPELFEKQPMMIDCVEYQVKPYGTLDTELHDIDEAILIAPKCYALINRKGKESNNKYRCKGVSFFGDSCRYSDGETL